MQINANYLFFTIFYFCYYLSTKRCYGAKSIFSTGNKNVNETATILDEKTIVAKSNDRYAKCVELLCVENCCLRYNGTEEYENYCCELYEIGVKTQKWVKRFSMWSMWYFWFAVILTMATCFTGCNYWCRQRRLQQWPFTQRHYAVISGAEAAGGITLVCPTTAINNSLLLNACLTNAGRCSTAACSDGNNREQQAPPPSYAEVISKPDIYPNNNYRSESQIQTNSSNCCNNNYAEPPDYDSLQNETVQNYTQDKHTR